MSTNEAMQDNKNDDGPSVFRFEAQILQHTDKLKADSWAMLDIPKIISKELRGMAKIEGTINGHPFRAPLEQGTSGEHRLRVNQAMLRGAATQAGDTVKLAILGPEPEPVPPADLQTPLNASHEAKTSWDDLTTMGRRDWIRWINLAKTPETRARRVTRTVDQLAEGKRRACCVNVNEFMMCRIEESELASRIQQKSKP